MRSPKWKIGRKHKKIEAIVCRDPIYVYQMGRVGSTSVRLSLQRTYEACSGTVPILHGHYLNRFEELETRVKRDLQDTSSFMKDLRKVEIAFREAEQEMTGSQKVKLISLVRDPVARNVSAFFFALSEFLPGWEQRTADESLTIDDIQQIFVNRRAYALSAFYWFEEQMEPVFNIDVYSSTFPKEKGYKIYSSAKADLLLLRLESLEYCAKEAFSAFLGIPNFQLIKVNRGIDRKAGGLYRLFRKKPLPHEYLEWSYSFRLARHFFSESEIKSFMSKWTTANRES